MTEHERESHPISPLGLACGDPAHLLAVVALLVLAGCAPEQPEQQQLVGADRSALSAAAARTYGFESLQDWSGIYSTPTLALSSTRTEALKSLSIAGGGWSSFVSRKLSNEGAGPTVVGFDLLIPMSQPNPSWFGTVQLFVDIPSRGINSQPLGLRDLKAWTPGQWKRAEFAVPSAVQSALGKTYADLRWRIELNRPINAIAPYLFDRFTLGTGGAVCTPSSDQNPCTTDTCDASGQHHVPVPAGGSCSDGNACNGFEACDGRGNCATGASVVCDALDQCHDVGTCDPATGECSNPAKPIGASCNDGDACTRVDECRSGICVGTDLETCQSPDPCVFSGVCDPVTGLCSNPSTNALACEECTAGWSGIVGISPFSYEASPGKIVTQAIVRVLDGGAGTSCVPLDARHANACFSVAGLGSGSAQVLAEARPDCPPIAHVEFFVADEPKSEDCGEAVAIPGRYLVFFEEGSAGVESIAAEIAAQFSLTPTHVFSSLGGFAAYIPDTELQALRARPEVVAVEQDVVVTNCGVRQTTAASCAGQLPTPQRISDGLKRVGGSADGEHRTLTSTGTGIAIAVLDTGIDASHPDLAGQVALDSAHELIGMNCVAPEARQVDDAGHGTAVASVIAAKDDAFGGVGVAPGALLYSIKIATRGTLGIDAELRSWLCAFEWLEQFAGTLGIRVVNISAGLGPRIPEETLRRLHAAIQSLNGRGVTIVVASPDPPACGTNDEDIPGKFQEVIAVTGLADGDGRPGGLAGGFSCHGSYADDTLASSCGLGSTVDLAAPSVCISTAEIWRAPPQPRCFVSDQVGTSFAAPFVTGAAALYLASHWQSNPTPDAVRSALRQTAEDGTLPGYPVLSLGKYLRLSVSGPGKVVTEPSSTQLQPELDCSDGSTGRCGWSFPKGNAVDLSAKPNPGAVVTWSDDCAGFGSADTGSLSMDDEKFCSVRFECDSTTVACGDACLSDETTAIPDKVWSQLDIELDSANHAAIGWLQNDPALGELTEARIQPIGGSVFETALGGTFPFGTIRKAPSFAYSQGGVLGVVSPRYDFPAHHIYYQGQLSPGVRTSPIVVDSTTQGDTAMAFDAQARPWLFYLSSEPQTPSGQRPRFAHWNGTAWQLTTVDVAPYVSNLSIAVSPTNGDVYGAYASADNNYNDLFFDVVRLTSNGNVAGTTRLASTARLGLPGFANGLQVDSQGRLHGAYLLGTEGDDVLVRYFGPMGAVQLAAIQYGTSNVAVALDSNDVPYVAYNYPDGSGTRSLLKVLKHAGGSTWVDVRAMTDSEQIWDFAFAIGRDSSLHLAYVEGDAQSAGRLVRYVRRPGCLAQ